MHGLRFLAFVSVKARGVITATPDGSQVAISVTPTLEEFWFLPFLIPVAVTSAIGSTTVAEGIVVLSVTLGLPLAWFFFSRHRESRETEAVLRSMLEYRIYQ